MFKETTVYSDDLIPTIFGNMVAASFGVIERYHSDLYHDCNWIKNIVSKKDLVSRGQEDQESIFWSVGDCGTHICMAKNLEECAWMGVENYAKYKHYKIEVEPKDFGVAIRFVSM